jgi:hypothetical protein
MAKGLEEQTITISALFLKANEDVANIGEVAGLWSSGGGGR